MKTKLETSKVLWFDEKSFFRENISVYSTLGLQTSEYFHNKKM